MIEFTIMLLSCVIGRRIISKPASSLRFCENHYLTLYTLGVVLFVLMLFPVVPVMGAETAASNGPQTAVEATAAEATAADAPAPMADIHDILPPVAVGIDAPWLIPVLIALVVVLLLSAAWWLWKKYGKNKTIETIVPELPPEMVAMQALDGISDVRLQEAKVFYFRISAIIRQYVFGRFSVGAPEMTTEEFLPFIDRLPIDNDLAIQLRKLCRAMDPVKFGGATVMKKQMEEDLFFARAFVRKTKQVFEPEENDTVI